MSDPRYRLRIPGSGRPVDAIPRPLPNRGEIPGMYTGGRTLLPDLDVDPMLRHRGSFAEDDVYGEYEGTPAEIQVTAEDVIDDGPPPRRRADGGRR